MLLTSDRFIEMFTTTYYEQNQRAQHYLHIMAEYKFPQP